MKVVHLQVNVSTSGNAVVRLHNAMCKYGIDSHVLTILPCLNQEKFHQIRTSKFSFIRKAIDHIICEIKKLGFKEGSYLYSALPFWGTRFHNHPIVKQADVIYLHWLAQRGISLREIEELAKTGKPIIFFMHDMWTFTAGCHHSFNCVQYTKTCDDCQFFKYNIISPSHDIKRKKKIYSKYKNIIFVSPSRWMAECAKQSSATKNNYVTTISNIIDETIFKPGNKNDARSKLGLPLDKKIIAFGCQGGLYNTIKGWKYLVDAINKLNSRDILVAVFGCNDVPESHKALKCQVEFLGRFTDESQLALIYQAVDVFVSPSLAESFGMTLLESSLCGTPIVAFNNTAIPEIVKTDITGYLAENKNVDDLAYGIKYVLNKKNKIKNNLNYSSKKIIEQHLELIQKISKDDLNS